MTRKPAVYWLVQIGADVPGDSDWLTERERHVLEGLRYVKRRADWRLGRWTAKRAVRFLSMARSGRTLEPTDIEIVAAPDGAPEAHVGGARSSVIISISHSGGVGFCAATPDDLPLGCDVETIGSRSDRFVSDFFTASEAETVLRASREERALFATRIWSAKESALKALRTGLDRDTRSVEVIETSETAAGEWGRLRVECQSQGRGFFGWWRLADDRVFTVLSTIQPGLPLPLV
jgi:4'-phosphopantetheinyl transferase